MRSGRALGVASIATVLIVFAFAASAAGIESHSEPGAASVQLQQSDVPGYTPVPTSVESLTDANDAGPNQAFVQCAGSTPLLDGFDSSPASSSAVDGRLYGLGQDGYGDPALIIGSVVFADGSTTDAEQALATLGGATFQQCWASTQDSLNAKQGIVVPAKPSTVSPLIVPSYGDATTAFTVEQHYKLGEQTIDGQLSLVAIRKGPVVVMLESDGFDQQFPTATLDGAIAAIAGRLGAAPSQPTKPTTGKTPCASPIVKGSQPLATSDAVVSAAAMSLTYQGWTLYPAQGGNVQNYSCTWSGPRVTLKHDPYYHGVDVYLAVRGPYAIGAARTQFKTDRTGWDASAASGIGDGYFTLPPQDDAQAIEVLCGGAILTVGMSLDNNSELTAHEQAERTLALTALQSLGQCQSQPTPNPNPSPTPPSGECSFSASPESDPSWVDALNEDFQRHLHERLPITVGTIHFPGPVYLNFAPAIELTSFDICASGLLDDIRQEPGPGSESLAFTARPAQCGAGSGARITNGSGSGGVLCTPENGVTVDGETTLGSFAYDGPSASWTAVDPKATPVDQTFTASWTPSVSVLSGVSGSWTAADGPQAELTLAELDIASLKSTIDLVLAPNASLEAEFGPSLSFAVQLSNKSLVQSLGNELAGGGRPRRKLPGISVKRSPLTPKPRSAPRKPATSA